MPDKSEYVELVTAVETNNTTLLTPAKSVLDGADIPCFAKGEERKLLRDFLEP